MITYGLDEDEAFALLRWHSQHTNIKLRDIAAGITDRTNDPDIAGLTPTGRSPKSSPNITDPATPDPRREPVRPRPSDPRNHSAPDPSRRAPSRG